MPHRPSLKHQNSRKPGEMAEHLPFLQNIYSEIWFWSLQSLKMALGHEIFICRVAFGMTPIPASPFPAPNGS